MVKWFNGYIVILLLTYGVLKSVNSFAQTVILDVDTPKDSIQPTFGKNRRHFVHLFGRYTLTVGEKDKNFPIKPYISYEWGFGIRYKLRINDFISLGSDLVYHGFKYKMETTIHKKEMFKISPLETDLFTRINFGKRGNHIGKYIDLGWGYNYSLSSAYITNDEGLDDTDIEVITSGLKGLHKSFQHVFFKFGIDRYVLYFSYRPDHIIKYGKPDFPRYQVGIELGLY